MDHFFFPCKCNFLLLTVSKKLVLIPVLQAFKFWRGKPYSSHHCYCWTLFHEVPTLLFFRNTTSVSDELSNCTSIAAHHTWVFCHQPQCASCCVKPFRAVTPLPAWAVLQNKEFSVSQQVRQLTETSVLSL